MLPINRLGGHNVIQINKLWHFHRFSIVLLADDLNPNLPHWFWSMAVRYLGMQCGNPSSKNDIVFLIPEDSYIYSFYFALIDAGSVFPKSKNLDFRAFRTYRSVQAPFLKPRTILFAQVPPKHPYHFLRYFRPTLVRKRNSIRKSKSFRPKANLIRASFRKHIH